MQRNLVILSGRLVHLGGGLGEEVGELLEGRLDEASLVPELGRQETVGPAKGVEGSLHEVTQSLGGSSGGGVHILDTGHHQHLLGGAGGNNTSSLGGGDQANGHGAALAGHLSVHGMGLTDLVTPVSATHGHDGDLRHDDGPADSGGHLLGALHSEADVAVGVTNNDEGLEAGALSGASLLLHGHDLHHLILEGRAEEELDNLVLLNGQRVEVDLLDGLNLALLDETAKLGAGHPLLLVILGPTACATATAAAIATASAATAVTTTATTVPAEPAAETTALTSSASTISHDVLVLY
mmetsp:Transcript_4919/g.8521  ORF Transcript_4919/g.8521 Transcript_4919/m.8521 type:complete len:296 (-) Transcript_4919:62-949(-)